MSRVRGVIEGRPITEIPLIGQDIIRPGARTATIEGDRLTLSHRVEVGIGYGRGEHISHRHKSSVGSNTAPAIVNTEGGSINPIIGIDVSYRHVRCPRDRVPIAKIPFIGQVVAIWVRRTLTGQGNRRTFVSRVRNGTGNGNRHTTNIHLYFV